MKVLLYFEGEKMISKSGVGRAMKHQMAALASQGIEYTLSADDDYDILHINTVGLNSSYMIKKARSQGKKVIYHAHSTEEDFRNSFTFSNQIAPFFKKRLCYLYGKADMIITPTPYSKSLLEGYGITVPIHAVSNGIDLQRFNYNEEKIRLFRDFFKLHKDDKVIICVGLFFVRKGILDFIEVAKRMPEYKFIWFGHVPLYSIPKNIRDIVTKDHPENVIFPGYVNGPVIEGAFCGADAFFFPSMEETEGIVVLEALASYQQVVVRDIPVYNPWLQDHVNCFKGKNVEEFVMLLHKIIRKELPDVSKNGRRTAEQRSITAIGKELRNIYDEVLKLP